MMSSGQPYKTLEAPCEGLYKEKGSRFLSFGFPVSTEEEVRFRLGLMKKKYYDARHICYAYRLGPEGELWRANDNGEPSSTAGKPILGQLVSYELSDVLMVVVRYFGGIKLGTGGLINAYRTAARDALSRAAVVEKKVLETVTLQFSYSQTDKVMKAIHDTQATLIEQTFGQDPLPCRLVVKVAPQDKQTLLSALE
ncbi:MAG TPA: YigZ family protein [Bacteroidales bacterium]|nr:YigZ family protein [Bacteroidales bacterium]HOR11617.1 YigZ family protein [Bacteroidales bacterium]HOZ19229.1 YigZ family protein [Bacteroidales bacterium]HPB77312.1 YigZ family protein [Bacteroidales bacterium]HPK38788.1 YigZ family protein [Bacteroidales bacterium]